MSCFDAFETVGTRRDRRAELIIWRAKYAARFGRYCETAVMQS